MPTAFIADAAASWFAFPSSKVRLITVWGLTRGRVTAGVAAAAAALGSATAATRADTARRVANGRQRAFVGVVVPRCTMYSLFHCDRFGQIAGFVDVAAERERQVAGQ